MKKYAGMLLLRIAAKLKRIPFFIEVAGDELLGHPIKNRAHLLHPSMRSGVDDCTVFEPGDPGGAGAKCQTDGHYLCARCVHMCHDTAVDRGLVVCRNEDHEHDIP